MYADRHQNYFILLGADESGVAGIASHVHAAVREESLIREAAKDAGDDKRNADYSVASEKCDAMAGDAKTDCTAAAKAKFGKI